MADGDESVRVLGKGMCKTDDKGEVQIDSRVQDSQQTSDCPKAEAEEMLGCERFETETETLAPDGGWGWMCVLGCFTVHILVAGMDRTFGVIYLILIDMFGSSAKLTGGVLSVFSACRHCLGPVSNSLANQFTARKVVISGGLLSSLGIILSAFPPNIYYMFITFGLIAGIGAALCYAPSALIVGQSFHKKRALANGIASLGSGIGSLALPPFLAYLVYHYDYSGQMLIMGAIMLNQVVSGALYRPLVPKRTVKTISEKDAKRTQKKLEMKQMNKENNEDETSQLPSQLFAECTLLESCSQTFENHAKENTIFERNAVLQELCVYGNLLKDARFLTFGLNWTFLAMCATTNVMFFGAIAEEHGVPRSQSPLLYTILSIFDIATRGTLAFVFDRDQVRSLRHHAYNISFVVMGVTLFLTPEAKTFPQFAVCALIIGISQAVIMVLTFVVIADLFGQDMLTHTLGLGLLFYSLGILMGPPIAGLLKDTYGTYRYSFYFSGWWAIAGAGMFLLNTYLSKRASRRKEME
ncbi:monocarboxylate transporter 12-like isoform X2 [Lingula anatina]|uniref:Monocarboxylate transporter 12-like isoform X2 n=1 Tax=Lingula anatina TaxID=7574 RepID=A0A1S3J8J4_LINAN|nr:monocarboxylate transporter 12-like isoform X2 [Lingula anatina]|eukprot:XP_013406720.1 monocarboxylate transporter 12-like isoform X2 [Lingula anatina]